MTVSKATQKLRILNYCAEHGSITVREASDHLRINSPTKRISELFHAGYDVRKEWESKINSDGETVRYLRYFIREPERSALNA